MLFAQRKSSANPSGLHFHSLSKQPLFLWLQHAVLPPPLPHSGNTGSRTHVPVLHNRVLPRVHCNVRHDVIPLTTSTSHVRQTHYIYYLYCIRCSHFIGNKREDCLWEPCADLCRLVQRGVKWDGR